MLFACALRAALMSLQDLHVWDLFIVQVNIGFPHISFAEPSSLRKEQYEEAKKLDVPPPPIMPARYVSEVIEASIESAVTAAHVKEADFNRKYKETHTAFGYDTFSYLYPNGVLEVSFPFMFFLVC
jgi:hypothetical protein